VSGTSQCVSRESSNCVHFLGGLVFSCLGCRVSGLGTFHTRNSENGNGLTHSGEKVVITSWEVMTTFSPGFDGTEPCACIMHEIIGMVQVSSGKLARELGKAYGGPVGPAGTETAVYNSGSETDYYFSKVCLKRPGPEP
jgi:hypothetical protein